MSVEFQDEIKGAAHCLPSHRKDKAMKDDSVHEQIAYYHARAQEYDESIFQTGRFAMGIERTGNSATFSAIMQHLQSLGPFEHILELACGTGIWTQTLVKIGRQITALDASSEMLSINRHKIRDARIHYQQADLFTWEPEQQYDLVFFAFWLSHVPPDMLDAFLAKVSRSTYPEGQLFIVDEYAPTAEDLQSVEEENYSRRTLLDGRIFSIVKVFYDLDMLQRKLSEHGFTASMHKTSEYIFFLAGKSRGDQ
jgi:ubiquinone/menaquinone biosynthesis C-methylase UbiE